MNATATVETPSRGLALVDEPKKVQWLVRSLATPAQIIPVALRITREMSREKAEQTRADQIIWARTAAALDLDIIEAVKHVAVISGAPVISAELARKAAMSRGCDLEIVESSSERAVVRGRRRGGEWSTVTFTVEDAARMGKLDVVWTKWSDGGSVKWVQREFDIITDTFVTRQIKDAPQWVQDAAGGKFIKGVKRTFSEAYFRHRTAMLLARASSMLTRMIDPVPTIDGVRISVDDTLDAVAAVTEPDVVPSSGPVAEIEPAATEVPADDDEEVLEGEIVADDEPSAEPVGDEGDTTQQALIPVDLPLATEAWRKALMAKCGKAKMPDDQRHALILAATNGRVSSSTQVRLSEANSVMQAVESAIAENEEHR